MQLSIKRKGRWIYMGIKLTAVFQKSPYGYIGYVEELPGANTQGKTLEETKKNLIEAIKLVLEANREITREELKGQDFTKDEIGEILV